MSSSPIRKKGRRGDNDPLTNSQTAMDREDIDDVSWALYPPSPHHPPALQQQQQQLEDVDVSWARCPPSSLCPAALQQQKEDVDVSWAQYPPSPPPSQQDEEVEPAERRRTNIQTYKLWQFIEANPKGNKRGDELLAWYNMCNANC